MAERRADTSMKHSPLLAQTDICVLAHNEAKHLEATLTALCAASQGATFPVTVYANGCTDRTVAIARQFAQDHPQVAVRELAVASKPQAWNAAFSEHQTEFLFFADGDILPAAGAAAALVALLETTPAALLATCRQIPLKSGLSLQQRLVGYMQTPLCQDFLAGGFYAIRRQAVADLLLQHGLTGLPVGITGDDAFLDRLVGRERLLVAECCCAYTPPGFHDYCRYLARIRWQNEQLQQWLPLPSNSGPRLIWAKLATKLRSSPGGLRLVSALVAVSLRHTFKLLAAPLIHQIYRRLGPIRKDGDAILQQATRSER